MTILFVTHYSGVYGANKSLYTLMLLLRQKYGVQPVVLLPTDGPMCEQLRKVSIPHKVLHFYWWVHDKSGIFQWLLNKRKQFINYFRIPKLCRLFCGYKLDLVYTNSVCVNVGVFMAEHLGLPHIWQYREAFDQLDFKLSLSNLVSRKIWRNKCTKVHVLISDYMMDYYSPYLPKDKMVRVYNGLDLPEGACKRDYNVIKGRLKVACVGIICDQKNQIEILKAQALLKNKGIEIETYFFGAFNQEYMMLMQQYIAENKLNDIAHIEGHTDNVFEALEEMNLGVVAAHDEAFGRVTIEYMLMHMPVVVSDSGANPELITPGSTGYIYPLCDVERLAECIERYVRDPELLQRQGDEAAVVAKRDFSAERNAELIYEQIKRAVE